MKSMFVSFLATIFLIGLLSAADPKPQPQDKYQLLDFVKSLGDRLNQVDVVFTGKVVNKELVTTSSPNAPKWYRVTFKVLDSWKGYPSEQIEVFIPEKFIPITGE